MRLVIFLGLRGDGCAGYLAIGDGWGEAKDWVVSEVYLVGEGSR